MIHIDASFTIFLSFLIFTGLGFYYLKDLFRDFLDSWINGIQDEIKASEDALSEAKSRLGDIKVQFNNIIQEIKILNRRSEYDLLKLKEQFEKDLGQLLVLKEKSLESRMNSLYRNKFNEIRDNFFLEVLDQLISHLRNNVQPSKIKNYNSSIIQNMDSIS